MTVEMSTVFALGVISVPTGSLILTRGAQVRDMFFYAVQCLVHDGAVTSLAFLIEGLANGSLDISSRVMRRSRQRGSRLVVIWCWRESRWLRSRSRPLDLGGDCVVLKWRICSGNKVGGSVPAVGRGSQRCRITSSVD